MASSGVRSGGAVQARPDDKLLLDPDEESLHHGGSFRTYMHHKMSKLGEQFEAQAADLGVSSRIFQGVAIHVNGYTSPSHQELKVLMAKHGGVFINYPTPTNHTHIICSNLTDAKIKQFEKARNPKPVVSPEWILESIKAQSLLPITPFLLSTLRDIPGQQRLLPLGTRADVLPAKDGCDTAHPMAASEANPATASNQPSPMGAPVAYDPAEMRAAQAEAARLRAACDMLKGAPKSSRDDPNFVESFFSASRLHFIGMWKTRLESLMLSGVIGGPTPTPGPGAQVIFHVDLDCFFASVAESEHPLFSGKPLAVCHSNNAKGTAEISSANYEARKYGIRAGMFMAGAKQLCPDLIVVPYNFERYQEVSEQAYKIMLACSACVQPLSCDEAFLDVTGLGDPSQLASRLRADIQAATGCTASVGIGHNLLIARLATKRAKPDGQCHIQEAEAASAMLVRPS